MKRIIIIGGCAAGPKAAAKAKRLNPDNVVELYTKENMVSYSACGLPYFIGGVVPNVNNLMVRSPEEFKKSGVDIFLNHECTKIIPEEKAVVFNNEKTVSYDELILCIGSNPIVPKINNYPLKNIFNLKVIDDGVKIKQIAITAKSVVIIGAGYIAIELLEAFVKNKLKIYVIEKSRKMLRVLDNEISDCVRDEILKRGEGLIEFLFEDEVIEFIGEEKFEGVKTKNGREIFADFCVIAVGVLPNISIAKEAGIEIGIKGGIRVDNKMRTSVPHIWAAGDCTEQSFIPTKQTVYMALGTIANKQGRVAAINASAEEHGITETFDGVLGSMITKYFDYSIAATGMSESSANSLREYINIKPIFRPAD